MAKLIQGGLCECMHWDSLHRQFGCTKCNCPAFSSRRAMRSADAEGVNQCYACGRSIEWAGDKWQHVEASKHDIRPVYDRADAGLCGECDQPIHRTTEGILRHSNGPHADHDHAPRIPTSAAGATQADEFITACDVCGGIYTHLPTCPVIVGKTNTALQSEPIAPGTSRDSRRMVNLTDAQECDDCGCLIIHGHAHTCVARIITDAMRG